MPGPVVLALPAGGDARMSHPAHETAASHKPRHGSDIQDTERRNGLEFGIFAPSGIASGQNTSQLLRWTQGIRTILRDIRTSSCVAALTLERHALRPFVHNWVFLGSDKPFVTTGLGT